MNTEEPKHQQFNEHDRNTDQATAEQIADAQVRLIRLIARCATQLIRAQEVAVSDETGCASK
ncbi:MAG TPA: hypothetical protein VMJ32_13775 [Pirellulales bacterium]|nr:hypothetical protein [Pirellulales bacterium]